MKNIQIKILFTILILICTQNFPYKAIADSSAHKSGFNIKIGNYKCPYNIFAIFVNPKENIPIEVLDHKKNIFGLNSTYGNTIRVSDNKWKWQAPNEPGLYPMKIHNFSTNNTIHINAFVMVPYNKLKGVYLNNYLIGTYPKRKNTNNPLYNNPKGFIKVTKENKDTLISPHFTLEQFLCKQRSSYPKYLVLRENLVLRLENILDELNAKGYPYNSLYVMSGYRTPYYNRTLRNVKFSRHVWGDAADVFLDEHPKDGIMDDINKDGKSDYQDAHALFKMIENININPSMGNPFTGGLGKYKKNKYHGPFVHVDTRGYKARW